MKRKGVQSVFYEAARTIFERNFRISNTKLESNDDGTYGLESLFVESKTKSKSFFTKLKSSKTPKVSNASPEGTYGLENLFRELKPNSKPSSKLDENCGLETLVVESANPVKTSPFIKRDQKSKTNLFDGTYGLENLYIESGNTTQKATNTSLKIPEKESNGKQKYGLEDLFVGVAEYQKRNELTLNLSDDLTHL